MRGGFAAGLVERSFQTSWMCASLDDDVEAEE
jgi:hypothetical protein